MAMSSKWLNPPQIASFDRPLLVSINEDRRLDDEAMSSENCEKKSGQSPDECLRSASVASDSDNDWYKSTPSPSPAYRPHIANPAPQDLSMLPPVMPTMQPFWEERQHLQSCSDTTPFIPMCSPMAMPDGYVCVAMPVNLLHHVQAM